MKATILKTPPQGYEKIFSGAYLENNVPNNKIAVSDYDISIEDLIVKKWNGTEWVEGATQEEIEEARKSQIPDPISRMRLRMQLVRMGISLGSILDAIGQIPDEMQRDLTFIMWNDAVTFGRYDAQLNAMASMLGITQDQLDYIFIEGNK